MKTLFIQSFLEGNYQLLKIKLLVVGICWIIVFFAMLADLISGCHKAKQRGEFRSSEGFKRTVSKFILYCSALMLAFLADCLINFLITSYDTFIPAIPYFSIILSLYIVIFVEGRSVLEKASDKKKKQLSKDIIMIAETLSKIKDKEWLEYIKSLNKEEEK